MHFKAIYKLYFFIIIAITLFSFQPLSQDSLKTYFIFVSSRNTGTVNKYDAQTGTLKAILGKNSIIGETQCVTIGPDNMLYVTSLRNPYVLKFNPDSGKLIGQFSSGYKLEKPTKMTFHSDGYLYVSQWGENQSSVVRFDAISGKFDKEVTTNLKGPLAHTWDSKGHMYVACFYSKDIQVFDTNGKRIKSIAFQNYIQGPSNIWFDSKYHFFYVADWTTGRILKFSIDKNDTQFHSVLNQSFDKLEGVALGPDGNYYACDWQRNLIQKIHPVNGKDLGIHIGNENLLHPNSIVFWKKQ